jgi:rhomboid protease GluP
LQRILASNTGGRFAAEQRLAHPLPLVAPNELEPATRASIIAFDKRLAEQQHALLGPAARERPPLATLAIGAALIAYFVVSLPGGSMDAENLVALGALVLPIDLVPGELWWRVFAAGFLHFGPMHLAMNLLGLWFLGTAIERYGRFLPVVVFLFASMGAFLLAVGFAEASAAEPRILVGASAGIMGLLGALASYALVGFKLYGHRGMQGILRRIGLIIGLQMLFDWSTPQVSGFAHIAGLACGAVLGIPLAIAYFRKLAQTLALASAARDPERIRRLTGTADAVEH